MRNYNYYENVKEDIKKYLNENGLDKGYDYNKLYNDMFIDDSVTGNGSGSYTFSREQAKEYVLDNEELVSETVAIFSIDMNEYWDKWEYLDVSIRCYVLGEILQKTIDEFLESKEV